MPNETDIGSAALGGNENQYPDRVEDVDKAHVMALAGDEFRTQAAHDRSNAELNDQEAARLAGEGEDRSDLYSERARGFRQGAERMDKEAGRIEEWAGILHEHPVAQEYIEAHPEVSFTPEGLANFERLLEYQKKDLDEHGEVPEDYSPDWGMVKFPIRLEMAVDKPPIPVPGSENYQQRLEESKLDSELASLLSNPNTTLQQLKEYFDQQDRAELQEEHAKVEQMTSVLEDVKSGRTGENSSSET